MADNFNLRQFLTENKLTKNAQLLKEGSDYGYEAVVDAIADHFEEGTPEYDQVLAAVEQAFHNNEVDTLDFSHDPSAPGKVVLDIAKGLGLDEAKEEEAMEEEVVAENTLTAKERRLVEMVQNALRIAEEENVDYTMGRADDPDQLPNPPAQLNIPEGDEIVDENPLPKYKNIDELMSNIEHGTNEAAHKYKMERMKEVAEALEAKVTSLEEGENAEHIDQKAVKQMRKDILALRKGEEKLRKEFEKKFANKKEKKETQTENKMENFDLRKFLIENKITTNSKMLNEGFLDNVAASIKGKSEQGKLAQDVLAKMGITKNPAEIFALGTEGGGTGPHLNEVQDYLMNGGDINTKIPFSKDLKSSAGGAIFKETYTFDFSKDIPTMKSGGKFIWNIQGGKWEPFGDKDGNENQEEPIDIESMKKESDAEPGTYVPQMLMMTIADAAKIWPDSHPGTPYGYGKRLKEMVEFMEGKKITKMTPEDVKEFESRGKKEETPSV